MVNNLLKNINNRIAIIMQNVNLICNVIRKYDDTFSDTDFLNISDKIDDMIKTNGVYCNYLRNTELKENEITFQIMVYPNVTPTIKVNLQSTRYYFTSTESGTTIVDNSSYNTTKTFTLKGFNTLKVRENDEGWKYTNITIKSYQPINQLKIQSNCPIVAIKSDLSDIDTLQNIPKNEIRVATMKNITNANCLFADNQFLRKADVDLRNTEDCYACFRNCSNLTVLKDLDLTNCTNCEDMFNGCNNLKIITFSNECTSIPNGLDLSMTSLNLDTLMDMIDTLPNLTETVDIYVPVGINVSSAIKELAKARGYNIIQK